MDRNQIDKEISYMKGIVKGYYLGIKKYNLNIKSLIRKINLEYTNDETFWRKIKEMKPNQRLCFIHTPKCGGTYAGQILRDLRIKNKLHIRAKKNSGITFTIIRDPVARFESLINYRLGESNPRNDWPRRLWYVYKNKNININKIVSQLSNREITGFVPYNTLTYWGTNIDIFITIDKLHDFLSYFGYNYSENRYKRKNISTKNRGKFSESTKKRIAKLYSDDVFLFERTVKVPNI